MKVLLTGATGYVGSQMVNCLLELGRYSIIAPVRKKPQKNFEQIEFHEITDISEAPWGNILVGVDSVVHLAGRAHVMNEFSPEPLLAFRGVNVDSTVALASAAIKAEVKRFIYISSVGVNGFCTKGEAFSEESLPAPHADYALSKLEAELALRKVVAGSGMELVIIRPPLIYAGHAPGNFSRLLKLVSTGLPLPFGLVHNSRSMIALENLVDFIALSLEHPAAANEVFLISDGVDFSTAEVVRLLSRGMNKKAYLLPVPEGFIRTVASLLCKKYIYSQLCGSLIVDSSKARNLLGWTPPFNPEDALIKAAQNFKTAKL